MFYKVLDANNYFIQCQNNSEDAEIHMNVIGTENTFQIISQISAIQSDSVMSYANHENLLFISMKLNDCL